MSRVLVVSFHPDTFHCVHAIGVSWACWISFRRTSARLIRFAVIH